MNGINGNDLANFGSVVAAGLEAIANALGQSGASIADAIRESGEQGILAELARDFEESRQDIRAALVKLEQIQPGIENVDTTAPRYESTAGTAVNPDVEAKLKGKAAKTQAESIEKAGAAIADAIRESGDREQLAEIGKAVEESQKEVLKAVDELTSIGESLPPGEQVSIDAVPHNEVPVDEDYLKKLVAIEEMLKEVANHHRANKALETNVTRERLHKACDRLSQYLAGGETVGLNFGYSTAQDYADRNEKPNKQGDQE